MYVLSWGGGGGAVCYGGGGGVLISQISNYVTPQILNPIFLATQILILFTPQIPNPIFFLSLKYQIPNMKHLVQLLASYGLLWHCMIIAFEHLWLSHNIPANTQRFHNIAGKLRWAFLGQTLQQPCNNVWPNIFCVAMKMSNIKRCYNVAATLFDNIQRCSNVIWQHLPHFRPKLPFNVRGGSRGGGARGARAPPPFRKFRYRLL